MMALKARLRLASSDEAASGGGFLLGVSRERYQSLVSHANVTVLGGQSPGTPLAGFAVTLPDQVLRASELWSRRQAILWTGPPPTLSSDARVGYFDQIACAPGGTDRRWAPALALAALLELVETGHQHVFATVVKTPVHNRAALPMLVGVGAALVGHLAEWHDGVGELVSEVYHLDCSDRRWPAPFLDGPLARRIGRSIARLREGRGTAG